MVFNQLIKNIFSCYAMVMNNLNFKQIMRCFVFGLLMSFALDVNAENYNFFEEIANDDEMFDAAYPQMKTDYSVLHNQFFKMSVGKSIIILPIKPISLIKKC
jgi:hypothetical protein